MLKVRMGSNRSVLDEKDLNKFDAEKFISRTKFDKDWEAKCMREASSEESELRCDVRVMQW